MAFFCIPFSFGSANLRHSDLIAGAPAMTAVAGLVNALQAWVGERLDNPSFTFEAFTLVYFSLERDKYPIRRPAQDVTGTRATPPSLLDMQRGHGEAMLVIVVEGRSASCLSRWLAEDPADCFSLLSGRMRFAGGETFIGLPGEFDNAPLSIGLHEQWSDLLSLMMRAYPTKGLLIQDMSRQLSGHAIRHQMTTLDALTDLLYQSQVQHGFDYERLTREQACDEQAQEPELLVMEEGGDVECSDLPSLFDLLNDADEDLALDQADNLDVGQEAADEYLGRLLASPVGYHELGVRQNGILYVEPVLGLTRARILPSVMKDLSDHRLSWKEHFWRWEHLPEYGLYRAVTY